jgi:hypothetical protein
MDRDPDRPRPCGRGECDLSGWKVFARGSSFPRALPEAAAFCLRWLLATGQRVPRLRFALLACPEPRRPTTACSGRNLAALGFAAEACYVGQSNVKPARTKPAKSFTTDGTGQIPSGVELVANQEYRATPPPDPPSREFDSKDKLLAWMRNSVLGDLRTLLAGIDLYLADPSGRSAASFGGANFLLASGCFLALEQFARTYTGKHDATASVRDFTKQFLIPIDAKYGATLVILWRAFRNGLVHGGWPKVVSIEGESLELTLSVGVDPRNPHLEPLPNNKHSLCLNGRTLLSHLQQAIGPGSPFETWFNTTTDDVLARSAPRALVISSGDAQAVCEFRGLAK